MSTSEEEYDSDKGRNVEEYDLEREQDDKEYDSDRAQDEEYNLDRGWDNQTSGYVSGNEEIEPFFVIPQLTLDKIPIELENEP
jgi:hypothetical protein